MNYTLLAATTAATCAIACAPHAAAVTTDADRYQPTFQTEPRYLPLVEGQFYTETTRFTPTGAPEGTTFRIMGQGEELGEPVTVNIDNDGVTLVARLQFYNCDQVEAGQLYAPKCTTVKRGENTRELYIEVTYPDGSQERVTTTVSLIADQRLIYEPVYKPVQVAHGKSFTATPHNYNRERVAFPTDAKFELINPPAGWNLSIDPVTGTVSGTATDAAETPWNVTIRATFEDGTTRTAGLELSHDGPNPPENPTQPQTPPADANGSSGSRALIITLGVLSTLAVVGALFAAFAPNIPALAPYLSR